MRRLNIQFKYNGSGQITIEYFILAAVIAVLTLVGMAGFHLAIRVPVQQFIDAASEAFAH